MLHPKLIRHHNTHCLWNDCHCHSSHQSKSLIVLQVILRLQQDDLVLQRPSVISPELFVMLIMSLFLVVLSEPFQYELIISTSCWRRLTSHSKYVFLDFSCSRSIFTSVISFLNSHTSDVVVLHCEFIKACIKSTLLFKISISKFKLIKL